MTVYRTEFHRPRGSSSWMRSSLLNYEESDFTCVEQASTVLGWAQYEFIVLAQSRICMAYSEYEYRDFEYMAIFTETPIGRA